MGWWSYIRLKGRGYRALPSDQRRQVLLAAALLPVVSLTLRCVGFRRCRRWMVALRSTKAAPFGGTPFCGAKGDNEHTFAQRKAAFDERAMVTARLVAKAARVWRSSCLPRSLVTWWLLRRQGIPGELRIGVRRSGERFAAHAWVEVQGCALDDGDASSFAPFEADMMRTP